MIYHGQLYLLKPKIEVGKAKLFTLCEIFLYIHRNSRFFHVKFCKVILQAPKKVFADRLSVVKTWLPFSFFSVHFYCFCLLQKEKRKHSLTCQSGCTPSHCANLEMGFTSSWFNVFPPAVSTLAAAEFVKLSATLRKRL